jgi:hypothetical protein
MGVDCARAGRRLRWLASMKKHPKNEIPDYKTDTVSRGDVIRW